MKSWVKLFWSKETCTSNISFLDFVTTSLRSYRVFEMEIEESDWLLAILIFLEASYLQSQAVVWDKESSEMPFRYMRMQVAKIAGAVTTKC